MGRSKKIKIAFYCNQLSIGGTERSMELFCKYLDREKFDVYVISKFFKEKLLTRFRLFISDFIGMSSAKAKRQLMSQMNARVPNFIEILGSSKVRFAKNLEDLRKIIFSIAS